MGAVTAATIALLPALTSSLPDDAGHGPIDGAGRGPVTAVGGPGSAGGQPEAGDEAVAVTRLSPQVVEPDSTLSIAGQVTNTGDEELTDVRVRLRYSGTPVGSRGELDDLTDDDHHPPQEFGPEEQVEDPIAPGETVEFTMRVDVERLTLSGPGVYPLAVDAVDGDWNEIGMQRSFLPLYDPDAALEATQIAWVWPLADRPHRADDDTYLGTELDDLLAPDGRLTELLDIGAELGPRPASAPSEDDDEDPDEEDGEDEDDGDAAEDDEPEEPDPGRVPLTWAVDPALLDDVSNLTTDHQVIANPTAAPARAAPSADPAEPSENAQRWLAEVRENLAGGVPLIASPYAAPDLVALVENDLESDVDSAVRLGRDTVHQVLDREADPTVAWSAGEEIPTEARDLLAEHDVETFLVNESQLPPSTDVSYTPTAEAALPTDEGDDATVLVVDSRLTSVLGASTATGSETTLALQRFTAETLLLALERPYDTGRTVVAAPPSDWDPGADFARGVLESSDDLPWLEPVALDEVGDDASATSERQEADGDGASAVLGDAYVDQIRDIRREARLFNSILTEDVDPFRPAILRLESTAWHGREELAGQARAQVATNVQDTLDQVRIIPGEPVTMASNRGQAPIIVANDLPDHSVTVHLSVFSDNSERLAIGNYNESMEIGPEGRTTVFVPLTATVNDRTVLHAQLHNATGEPISGEEVQIPVTVTNLGTSALLIAAGAALLFVLLLLPRLVRRFRRRAGGTPDAALEGDAEGDAESSGHDDPADAPDAATGDLSDDTADESSSGTAGGTASAGVDGAGSAAPSDADSTDGAVPEVVPGNPSVADGPMHHNDDGDREPHRDDADAATPGSPGSSPVGQPSTGADDADRT